MQKENTRRTNKARTEETRTKLIAAARALFVEKGYAETGTPEIVKKAEITRGALYHHFQDKADLFREVAFREAQTVAKQIQENSTPSKSALDALLDGADAYFKAMAVPGRSRLLLLEGPAVLGQTEMDRIDKETGGGELKIGITEILKDKRVDAASVDALTELMSASFDRAALAISSGNPPVPYRKAITLILQGLSKNTQGIL